MKESSCPTVGLVHECSQRSLVGDVDALQSPDRWDQPTAVVVTVRALFVSAASPTVNAARKAAVVVVAAVMVLWMKEQGQATAT